MTSGPLAVADGGHLQGRSRSRSPHGLRVVSRNQPQAAAVPEVAAAPSAPEPARLVPTCIRIAQYAVFPLTVLLLWWFAARQQWMPSNILPGPGVVVQSFWDLLVGGDIAEHLGISLWRMAQGVALGVSLGLLLGVLFGTSDAAESWLGPSFRLLAQVPSIALIPLLMMFLGIDEKLKIFIMTKACVIPLTIVVAAGIRNISTAHLEAARVMQLSRRTLYSKVIFPGALPSIMTGLRQGVAHVWVALVAVELMTSAEGIGYLMTWSRQIFQIDIVLVCIAVIGLTGFLLDYGLRRVEARLLRWRDAK